MNGERKIRLLWRGDDGEDFTILYWSEDFGYYFTVGERRVDVSIEDLLELADVIRREKK